MKKFKSILSTMLMVLSIMGIVTFSMFIQEEAFQTVMFGTWQAKDDPALTLKASDLMEEINYSLKLVNYSAGWIQPLAFVSYYQYARAADFYIEALRTNTLAKCPECFEGRTVAFLFTWKQAEPRGTKFIVSNGAVRVWMNQMPREKTLWIEGTMRKGVIFQ